MAREAPGKNEAFDKLVQMGCPKERLEAAPRWTPKTDN
jgi:hypothetical protein